MVIHIVRLVHGHRGIALVVTLVAMSVFAALGMALALSSAVERMAASNHDEATSLVNMADAGLELAARDLGRLDDWSLVLAGVQRSPLADGLPDGVRQPWPGTTIDLTGLTNDLTCGQWSACSDANIRTSTVDRPWGANNPRWRPFLYKLLTEATSPRQPTPSYVVVWLGDDGSEVDGDPLTDGGGPRQEGRYILRARSEAFGAFGTRRAIEAELIRLCRDSGAGETCLPGIRVQSWRVAADVIP